MMNTYYGWTNRETYEVVIAEPLPGRDFEINSSKIKEVAAELKDYVLEVISVLKPEFFCENTEAKLAKVNWAEIADTLIRG